MLSLNDRSRRMLIAILLWSSVPVCFGEFWHKSAYRNIPLQANVPAAVCFGPAGGFKTLGRQAKDQVVTAVGIPFWLNGAADSPRCLNTGLESIGSISLPIQSPAHALYLLAATRAIKPNRDDWDLGYADDAFFHARIHYRDHGCEEVVPKILPSGEYLAADWKADFDKQRAALTLHEDNGASPSLFVYCIEPGRRETIDSIDLLDLNDRFALALFAVTLDRQRAISREPALLPEAKPPAPENLKTTTPTLKEEGSRLIGQSTMMNFVLDFSKGMTFREIASACRLGKILETPKGVAPCPLFKIKIDEIMHMPEDFKVTGIKLSGNDRQSTAILSLEPIDPALPIDLKLSFGLANPGALHMRMIVEARHACAVWPVFPMIQDIGLGGHPETNGYYFPLKGGILHDRPADLYARYLGSSAGVQFMDVFDRELGGGLTLRVEDNQNFGKGFELRKMEGHNPCVIHNSQFSFDYLPTFARKSTDLTAMAVQYLSWKMAAGERLSFPETVLEVHQGDWREAMKLYLSWMKTWYRPDQRPPWVMKIFTLMGAMPADFVGPDREYTTKPIKDYIDFVCLYQWYLGSRELPDWFVGDFDFYPNDPQKLREFLKRLQARGVRTSVYTNFYCTDSNSKIGKAKGEAWTRRTKDGGYLVGLWKYNPCHAMEEMQDYVTSVTSRIVKGLDVDGVYYDQSARCYSDCYTPSHRHRTAGVGLAGNTRMFQKIHTVGRRINPLLATWSEEIGTEPMTQYLDLAYSYSCCYQLNGIPSELVNEMPREMAIQGENFYRFIYPDIKLVEITGENNSEGSRLAFFNATGIFSRFAAPLYQDLWRRLTRAFHRHADAFSSRNVEALVPTMRQGLYANGFYCDYEKVYTLFNANYRSVNGELMELPAIEGAVYTDIFSGKELKVARRQDKVVLSGEIAPREVWGIVVGLPGK